ncbi:MAG: hypothetical protein J3K34DRAFT_242455 [Monoraphidium minutum]|nr:MAG: hypothetical protein J3K34DRAFT_242455 [Monoraphidium minutum]
MRGAPAGARGWAAPGARPAAALHRAPEALPIWTTANLPLSIMHTHTLWPGAPRPHACPQGPAAPRAAPAHPLRRVGRGAARSPPELPLCRSRWLTARPRPPESGAAAARACKPSHCSPDVAPATKPGRGQLWAPGGRAGGGSARWGGLGRARRQRSERCETSAAVSVCMLEANRPGHQQKQLVTVRKMPP